MSFTKGIGKWTLYTSIYASAIIGSAGVEYIASRTPEERSANTREILNKGGNLNDVYFSDLRKTMSNIKHEGPLVYRGWEHGDSEASTLPLWWFALAELGFGLAVFGTAVHQIEETGRGLEARTQLAAIEAQSKEKA